ncbi:hypothetical protein AC579_4582 [Pseudocercospora musae]|uniref:Uncharacterized protein n=1 Tax=Pseudocercospora musae TaxID=113226 RepID=A0A139ITJ8_9PEZI|nr:hypothetical protein AC579_4582 [Pseudocercospora musae]
MNAPGSDCGSWKASDIARCFTGSKSALAHGEREPIVLVSSSPASSEFPRGVLSLHNAHAVPFAGITIAKVRRVPG